MPRIVAVAACVAARPLVVAAGGRRVLNGGYLCNEYYIKEVFGVKI